MTENIKNKTLRLIAEIICVIPFIPFILFLIVWLNWLGPWYEKVTGKEMWNPK
jgi:hypothetical protein